MKILVACEESQEVTAAFIALGHDAMSCDIDYDGEKGLPHYRGDVRDILYNGWDMMIAHPPCTYLTVSANKWYKDQPPRKSGALVGAERRQAREDAIKFFMLLWSAPIERIAIENPVGVMSTRLFKPQVIQPYQFGHGETKATCLWLKNLPELKETNRVDGREQRLHKLPPTKDRQRIRSRTFPGIAAAMAEQWGGLDILNKRS